ncbi:MAG: pyrroloquinoline-quinone synthase PqqC [Candidatus Thiodiazotropha sp. (ex Lucinoma kastoroae)]|nr:pyrroloquinoline-quinone synthase PqqC [Candidatus Thiodiazotropha sp. (ex Lucinoma kastoroae)]MCU7861131.1 pyrroloquinoline-quinone synthase PqqC [Candidatus Thiodiazotropha sp. (ex Lucinoma kastoroae)]MCU7871678.1 pyrroloquinoline-quinone synthase PqqC [Candidatus Thiodiazotropha sp. (ex Lucinoma borealis)]
METQSWSQEEFESALRARSSRYHIHHPYHRMMANGALNPEQIRGWVANRFYYQINIPRKDAALMANCPDPATRRIWLQRILDHDGYEGEEGGIEAWVRLGIACGLTREEIWSQEHVLPGVRFAVNAYLEFVRNAEWHEGICSSLTELFAPKIHRQRLENWPRDYPWIESSGLDYFRKRVSQASRDVEHGLAVTLAWFNTPERQQRALEILQLKLDILWSMLDAMYMAYVLEMPPYFNQEDVS